MTRTALLLAAAALAAPPASAAPPARADEPGKTLFLGVAVSHYPKFERFRPLDHAPTDVIALANRLGRSVDDGHVLFLLMQTGGSDLPTTANVRARLAEMALAAKPNDRVVVVLSGHGFETEDRSAVFCTSDSSLDDPASMIRVDEVVLRVKALPCRQKLVVVDACRNPMDDVRVADVPADARAASSTRPKQRPVDKTLCVIQSCSSGQFAHNDDKSAGIMAQRLIRAVDKEHGKDADADGDGSVTADEAVDYVRKHVRADVRRVHPGQRQDVDVSDPSEEHAFALAAVPARASDAPRPPEPVVVAAAGPRPATVIGAPVAPGVPDLVTDGRTGQTVEYAAGGGYGGGYNGFGGNAGFGNGQMLNLLAQPNLNIPRQFGNVPIPGVRNPVPPAARPYLDFAGKLLR